MRRPYTKPGFAAFGTLAGSSVVPEGVVGELPTGFAIGVPLPVFGVGVRSVGLCGGNMPTIGVLLPGVPGARRPGTVGVVGVGDGDGVGVVAAVGADGVIDIPFADAITAAGAVIGARYGSFFIARGLSTVHTVYSPFFSKCTNAMRSAFRAHDSAGLNSVMPEIPPATFVSW